MKILVTGASGLIGGRLSPLLEKKGHSILALSRKAPRSENDVQWDPKEGFSDKEAAKLENVDSVIHLAGENVAENWTDEKKRRIRQSRVEGTRTLVDALSATKDPPKSFISASAIGYYGSRGDEVLTEESEAGTGFLPDVSREWEAEAERAGEFGARVACIRIGIVLSKDGGALAKMLTPFKFGVGGTVGSGDQWMSWIAIDDVVKAFAFVLDHDDISGPVNAVSPNPVRNEEFTNALGEVLSRPTILPVPSFGVKLLFGEMGERLLLEGQRVMPSRLSERGFAFEFPELAPALRHVLAEV